MDTIGIRDLRQHASRYVKRAQSGERIEITDRGRPVATLGPSVTSRWQNMVDAGQVIPASGDLLDIEPGQFDIAASTNLETLRAHER